ncbi:MAG: histidine phosphatase family protein [Spirochaetes bacterium]|nr:histidine phosphatase family protein [Spirochaetota bacterium]
MSTIFFIRHGQASFGKDNYDQLSETGKRQSRLLARHFSGTNRWFDIIYAGTLERHTQTLEEHLLTVKEKGAQKPAIISRDGLNEYPTEPIFRVLAPVAVQKNPSLMEDVNRLMTDRRSFQKVFEAVMSLWAAGTHDIKGLMSWKEFTGKVNEVIDEIMRDHGTGKTVAVFTSGGPISVAVRRVLHLANDDTMRVAEQIVNSSVSRFKCTRDRIMIATFNEYTHLELEHDDTLITYR